MVWFCLGGEGERYLRYVACCVVEVEGLGGFAEVGREGVMYYASTKYLFPSPPTHPGEGEGIKALVGPF